MSSYAAIVIGGLEVHEFTDHYDRWFFRKSDRVIECGPYNESDPATGIFIGFRATVGTIRKRMTLAGFDLPACERYFSLHCNELVSFLQKQIDMLDELLDGYRLSEGGSSRGARNLDAYQRFVSAVSDSSLDDWISAFPEAVARRHIATGDFFNGAWWCDVSSNHLVNAMLSFIPTYRKYPLTGVFNFPGPHWNEFTVAFLASCPDEATCELNVADMMEDDDGKDFWDVEELMEEETQPHRGCRKSVKEILALSETQPDNPSLQRMCYASIITAMEAYLGDILKREIFSRPAVKQLFVASYEPFRKQKLLLSDLYAKLSVIDAEIKDALDGLSLHKIETAKNIFSSTLLTEFPESSLPFLGAAVKRRHDIVHRNGKDTEGELLPIGHNDVDELGRQIELFIRAIDAQILNGMQLDIDAERD